MKQLTYSKQAIINSFSKSARFVAFVTQRFIDNGNIYRAAALTFTSLLAIVPLMSLMFTILSAFPVFKHLGKPIQDFIFKNFIPSTGTIVQNYLQSFTDQATKLSISGIVFLVITAVLVMFTIERAMNQIWHVRRKRQGAAAFLLYWAVLTLAPLLMSLSLVVSSYLISLPLLAGTAVSVGLSKSWLLNLAPFFLAVVTFTLLYVAVPNCKVALKHGLIGAVFAAILFDLAKAAFTYYLQQFHLYELLYGAFATVPIFFLWVFWVWVIVLLGAEVSHALSAYYDRRLGAKYDAFSHAFTWLGYMWQAQQRGDALSFHQLIDLDKHNYDVDPDEQLTLLLRAHLIRRTANGRYVLSRDLSHYSFGELYRALPWQLPGSNTLANIDAPWHEVLVGILSKIESANKVYMETALVELYKLAPRAGLEPATK